jgi:hypothetical protein
VNRSDLDSHDHACVGSSGALLFQDFDNEVTVSAYDPDGAVLTWTMCRLFLWI